MPADAATPTGTTPWQLRMAARTVRAGGVIAYPTEAVYGLGCDPCDGAAVYRILDLKQRDPGKGLILIAADFAQLEPYVAPLSRELMVPVLASWPGPDTWILPAAAGLPYWLNGGIGSIAVRVTAHPLTVALCRVSGCALVSTSANPAGLRPARSALRVRRYFGGKLDRVVSGPLGNRALPSRIHDVLSGKRLR